MTTLKQSNYIITPEIWTEILQHIGKVPLIQIAEKFNIKKGTIQAFAHKRGISTAINKIHRWSKEETDYLKEKAGWIPAQEIADHLGISRRALFAYAERKRILLTKKNYDPEDVRLAGLMWDAGMRTGDISEKLELSINTVNRIVKYELRP